MTGIVASPGPGPAPTAAEVLAQSLDELTATLRDLAPAVRKDAPDAIHKARTTNRRLRSLLALGSGLLATDTAAVEDTLAHLGTSLGIARDTEVRIELVAERLGRRKSAGLLRVARKEHAKAVKSLVKEIDHGLLDDALDALDAHPAEPSELGRLPAREVLPGLLQHAVLVVREAAVAVASAGTREDHEDRLHDVRKASRAVRYAAEAVRGRGVVDDLRARELATVARTLQDVLGQWRDLLLLLEWCDDQRGRVPRAPRERMRAVREDAAALEAAWPDALADLVVPDWTVTRV